MTKFTTASLILAALSSAPAVKAQTVYKRNFGATTCYDVDMSDNPSGYYTTRAACCEQLIPSSDDEAYENCVTGTLDESGVGGEAELATDPNINKWYLDYDRSPDDLCSRICPDSSLEDGCGGHLHPNSGKATYTSAEDCCSAQLSYLNVNFCAANSMEADYQGSGGYYVDSTDHICVKDCEGAAPCGGILKGSSVTVFDSGDDTANIAACCASLSYDLDICTSQSTPDSVGSLKWFVEGSECKKDCRTNDDACSTISRWNTPYDDAEECCSKGLGYLNEDYCESRSDPATHGAGQLPETNLWYVNWQKSACAQDCSTSNPACDLLTANAILHETAEACCAAHLGSVDADQCETSSETGVAAADATPTATGEFYADYSITPALCVRDCESSGGVGCGGLYPRNAGVTSYDDAEDCCKNKFGWYQLDLCTVLSNSAGASHTDLWYADQGDGVCHKDCDDSGNPSCGGTPTDFSQPMYDSAEECCREKLGWINEDTCTLKSSNGAGAAAVGTNQWFVNWQTNRCDKDCVDSNGADGCRGVHEGSNVVMHDDAETCCKTHFSWINSEFCESRSNDSPHSGLFYPDQGAGVCHQDCDTSVAGCDGPPSDLGVDMYDTAEACCTGSVGWADQAVCSGASLASLSTDEYWINWEYGKCVKNCPKGEGINAACGGIANTWNLKYSSTSSCCSQPAFNGQDDDDCVYEGGN